MNGVRYNIGDKLASQVVKESVEDMLRVLDPDDSREGLRGTPDRVARMYVELTSGYLIEPAELLRTFECNSDGSMVVVKSIPFYSLCEHHMMPFFGEVALGYLPFQGRVVGLSKIGRLVDAFARRLQVQERMTTEIITTFVNNVSEDVMVVVEARHLCMEIRGVEKPGAFTVTSAVNGKFKDSFNVRQEFLSLIGRK